jgi:deoxyhypusine synthase
MKHECESHEHHCPSRKELLGGKVIEPLRLKGNENVRDFIKNVFSASGYNARRLGDACEVLSNMIKSNATICLTLAGAMTPIGMSGPIIEMMEAGFIDYIIATGANLYHDIHRAFNFPMIQGESFADDTMLNKEGVARIYDVYIGDEETLLATDKIIIDAVYKKNFEKPISTADLHHMIGEHILKKAPHPEKSLLAVAARLNVPVYTSSPGDSSIAMNLVLPHYYDKPIMIDALKDIVETSAIVHESDLNGAIEVGGGSPKNFFMQTQPMLWQVLDLSKGGHDFFIQLTTDSPQWGGLSGATPQEAKSWGKIKDAMKNNAVVYSCASLTFPLLCQFALMSHQKRQLKQLFSKKDAWSAKIIALAKKSDKVRKDYGHLFKL